MESSGSYLQDAESRGWAALQSASSRGFAAFGSASSAISDGIWKRSTGGVGGGAAAATAQGATPADGEPDAADGAARAAGAG